MAAETCALTVTDYTGDREGGPSDILNVQAVSMDLTIFEVKELICGEKKDPKFTAANTLLYMGKNLMDNKKKLKAYNRSHRTNLALELHDLKHINVTVKTLQNCGKERCVVVPLWAFCCRQQIRLKVPSHETVGYLRSEIARELGDPVGHPAPKLQLFFRRNLLDDDSQDLVEVGLADGSSVTVFVGLCFFRKKPAEGGGQTTDAGASSSSPRAAPTPLEGAAEGDEAAAAAAGGETSDGAVQAPPLTQGSQPQAMGSTAGAAAPAAGEGGGTEEHPGEAAHDAETAGEGTSS